MVNCMVSGRQHEARLLAEANEAIHFRHVGPLVGHCREKGHEGQRAHPHHNEELQPVILFRQGDEYCDDHHPK